MTYKQGGEGAAGVAPPTDPNAPVDPNAQPVSLSEE